VNGINSGALPISGFAVSEVEPLDSTASDLAV
jgi:hypothetical protein